MTRSRSGFQQDADLIVFSGAFRRLQSKTQVHPLEARGKVRTRLTHSIEVASVGRSLGTACGLDLRHSGQLTREQADALSHVVFAACLAHDIGNPPFGHAGEDLLGQWFVEHPEALQGLDVAERADLTRFEGNAQGLRIVTQLENYAHAGGLRLTYATLGAFMKYTVGADEVRGDGPAGARKPGFFQSERSYVEQIRDDLGLTGAQRHPLAFLTEAADDICYAIIDVEDGHAMGLIEHAEAREALEAIAGAQADLALPPHAQLQKLRGIAIGQLVEQVARQFVGSEAALREGGAQQPLLEQVPAGAAVAHAKQLSARRVFRAPSVLALQRDGLGALGELLDVLVADVTGQRGLGVQQRLRAVSPELLSAVEGGQRGQALRTLVDSLASLTDEHALTLRDELRALA